MVGAGVPANVGPGELFVCHHASADIYPAPGMPVPFAGCPKAHQLEQKHQDEPAEFRVGRGGQWHGFWLPAKHSTLKKGLQRLLSVIH